MKQEPHSPTQHYSNQVVHVHQCPPQKKKNSRVLPDSKQICEKNMINVQMYVMNDYATHTYTICNLKQ